MTDAARSKRMRAQRLAWGAQSDEEARAYLQQRLAVFSKALFWSFVALVVFLFAMYAAYPEIEPDNQNLIYGVATLALAALAFLWRVVLVRGKRSVELLNRIDLVISIGSGCTFGIVAPLAYKLEAAAYTCLLYESFVVFTRALLVPSSERRTLIVSSLAFVPIVAGSIVLAVLDWKGIADLEIPGLGFVAGDLLYNAVAVLLATTGSRIIYTLKKQVTEAKQLGQYTLGKRIGAGGMGAVYMAQHALLRRETAIKLVLPEKVGVENLEHFEREVQSMSTLTHPNTVAVFDYGRGLNGELYYAMEYLDGLNLQDLVVRDGPQPAGRVIQILTQVCGALQEAHDAGMIHRDIKPANIILCKRGGVPDVAKVVDFGLVQEIKDAKELAVEALIGTPGYIAPESILPPGTVSKAVDLYALGVTAYFLLTKTPVFSGDTIAELVSKQISGTPKPFAEVTTNKIPPELETIVMKCLAKQPADRYESPSALAEALADVPDQGDWNRARATAWWDRYKAQVAATPSTDAPTVTLAIELANRLSPAPPQPNGKPGAIGVAEIEPLPLETDVPRETSEPPDA